MNWRQILFRVARTSPSLLPNLLRMLADAIERDPTVLGAILGTESQQGQQVR